MKNNEKSKSMTYEEALKDPSMAEFHEIIRRFQTTPHSQIFPKKHEMGLLSVVEINTRKLFIENPNMPIKTVLTTVFEPLTEDIPAPLVLKLTKKIIQKWESLSATLLQNNDVLTSV